MMRASLPWDDRYANGDWADIGRPAAILTEAEPWLGNPGLALDLACGAGRNALFLAERGWRVLAADLSLAGVRRLAGRVRRSGRADARGRPRRGGPGAGQGAGQGADLAFRPGDRTRRRALQILPVLADLERFAVEPGSFDLVVNTRFLLRSLFPLIRGALKPGGLLVFETFSIQEIEELGGDLRRAYVLERGELPRAFSDFEILRYEEGVFRREAGERGLARLVARKPGG
ncbi:MAG: class I SAM-dependent methyltransferase [Gemmatimonadota bacterium]